MLCGGAGGAADRVGAAHLATPMPADMVLVSETDLMVHAVNTLAHLALIPPPRVHRVTHA